MLLVLLGVLAQENSVMAELPNSFPETQQIEDGENILEGEGQIAPGGEPGTEIQPEPSDADPSDVESGTGALEIDSGEPDPTSAEVDSSDPESDSLFDQLNNQGGDLTPTDPNAIDPFAPRAILKRNDEDIVAIKTSPDEFGVAIIQDRDLLSGKLTKLDRTGKTLQVGEKSFSISANSLLPENIKLGDSVTVEYIKADSSKTPEEAIRVSAGTRKEKNLQRFVYSDPSPYRVTINLGKDAMAFGALALVEKYSGGEERISLDGGSATFSDDTGILSILRKKVDGSVEVRQGQTTVFGAQLDYDNNNGDAKIAGPLSLKRSGEKPLEGTATNMVYNVDRKEVRLIGKVNLVQDGRTTTAEHAVLLESEKIAYLYGTGSAPVRSENKDGFVLGNKMIYNLDTGSVVVLEGVGGEFTD